MALAAIAPITGATRSDTDTHRIQLVHGALYLSSLYLIICSFSITDRHFLREFMRKLLQRSIGPWLKSVYGVNKQPSAAH